jgi:hypothetical protein
MGRWMLFYGQGSCLFGVHINFMSLSLSLRFLSFYCFLFFFFLDFSISGTVNCKRERFLCFVSAQHLIVLKELRFAQPLQPLNENWAIFLQNSRRGALSDFFSSQSNGFKKPLVRWVRKHCTLEHDTIRHVSRVEVGLAGSQQDGGLRLVNPQAYVSRERSAGDVEHLT